MLQSSEDALRFLAEGETLLGEGWTHVNNFDEIDEEEYEEEEEEIYVTMDLGTTLDSKALQSESHYQLVLMKGLDTPLPFLKLGNQIFQGQSTPLIGDEVILGMIRNSDNPHEPSHPPLHSTNHRLTFRAITLEPRTTTSSTTPPPPSSVLQPNEPSQGNSLKEGEAGPGPSSSLNIPSVSNQHPFFSSTGIELLDSGRASMKGQRGHVIGRPKGTNKPRRVIDKLEDLENFDLGAMKTSQKVELGPNVLEHLGLPPSRHGENVTLTKSVLSQVISGYPELGQSSRMNKGDDVQIPMVENRDQNVASSVQDHQEDVQMIGDDQPNIDQTNPQQPSDTLPQMQQDQVMLDVEDDPPWAEVGQHEPPP